jgi:hypothetical protein
MEAPARYTLPDWQRIYRPAPALPPLGDGEAVLVVRPDDPIFAETLGRESLAPHHRTDVAYTRHVTRLRESVDIDGAIFVLLGEWDATRDEDPFEDSWAFYRAPGKAIDELITSNGVALIPATAGLTPAPAPVEALASVLPFETRFTRAPPPVVGIELEQLLRLVATGLLTTDDAVLELAVDETQPGTKAFDAYLAKFGDRIFVHGTCFAQLEGEARAAAVRSWVEQFHVPQARPSLPPQLRPKKSVSPEAPKKSVSPAAAAPKGSRRRSKQSRRRSG